MKTPEQCTGAGIVVASMIEEGMPYVAGIPGHGNLAIVAALQDRRDEIRFVQVKQEMSAVHLAEGYYRVRGIPLAVITSIGPGAANCVIGAANAYADSKPVLIITGDTHVHMRGKGVLQEIERQRDSDLSSVFVPVTKRSWNVASADQLPATMHRAFNYMLEGRKGPVHVNLPFDVQADPVSCSIPGSAGRWRAGSPAVHPDPAAVDVAARMLMEASRPVILVGGGVVEAGAFQELLHIAERLGAPVINTMMGQSAFPADHELYAWCGGSKGTTVGNNLARKADVLLALGTRFADETTSSYRKGATYAVPPTRVVHVDVDPHEIGKNYPVAAGIVGDVKVTLRHLLDRFEAAGFTKEWRGSPYHAEIVAEKRAWIDSLAAFADPAREPVMISVVLREARAALARDAIVVTSSGNVQAQLLQEFPFYEPKTCITTGGFSTMGFAVPAAIGAKLAAPDRQVCAMVGDGDFMMTMAELSTAVQEKANILVLVLNNMSWMAIKDLQCAAYGPERAFGCDFEDVDGAPYTPDFAAIGAAFGCHAEKVSKAAEIGPAMHRALTAGKPGLIEILVNREHPFSGSPAVGWWDVPIPADMDEKRRRYEVERREEQLG